MTKLTPAELIESTSKRLDVPELIPDEGPEGETSLQLLQNVYRNRKQPLNVRVRCAVEALAHEYPRVSAVAVSHMNGHDFASALERAIERSKKPLPLPPRTVSVLEIPRPKTCLVAVPFA